MPAIRGLLVEDPVRDRELPGIKVVRVLRTELSRWLGLFPALARIPDE
jgi:hypothetical protein